LFVDIDHIGDRLMPQAVRRDPLLAFAQFLVGALAGLFAFAGIMVAIGLGAVATVQRDYVFAKLAAAGLSEAGYGAVLFALVLIIMLMALGAFFMRELFRLVGSVEEGDPFRPFNADRLRRMGWNTVASQLILFALAAIAHSFGGYRQALLAEDAMLAGFSALLLTLILFILARVFRVGAEMRSELEGTV